MIDFIDQFNQETSIYKKVKDFTPGEIGVKINYGTLFYE